MTTYRDSGVDIDAGDEFVDRIKPLVRSTFRPEVLTDLGGFGGLFRLQAKKYEDPVLVSGTDGIYSSQDGFYLRRWDHPGYVFDRIAYIENDGSVMWLAFARSILNQYTQWSSTDLINWEASNNNVHVSGHTLGS